MTLGFSMSHWTFAKIMTFGCVFAANIQLILLIKNLQLKMVGMMINYQKSTGEWIGSGFKH